jgi:ABC-type sugar transport system substrate-binding protein
MKSRFRLAAVAAVLALIVVAVAYGGTQSTASPNALKGKKVAWVMWGTDPYALAATGSFKKAAEAAGVQATLIDGKNDPVVQAKAIDTLIAEHVDGIVWQPSDPASAVAPAKKIRAAGIPLVFANVKPAPSARFPAPYAPPQNIIKLTYQAGQDAAKFVTKRLHQTPKVVIFDLVNLPICHQQRMVPFVNGVKSVSKATKVVFWDTVPVTKDGTLTKMENLLQANPDFNIFTGCGGDLIVGGFAGLQNAGRGQAVNGVPKTEWVLMIDGTPEQLKLQLDKNASVVETIMQTPYSNGQAAWNLLKKVLQGRVSPTSRARAITPPAILFKKSWSCQRINRIFSKQYSAVYPPLKC